MDYNKNEHGFTSIIICVLVVVAIVATIYLDVYFATSPDIPLWGKLLWFFRD